MTSPKNRPLDDPSSAPESGTVREDTSGNQPAAPHERPPQAKPAPRSEGEATKDDPSVAPEEK
jgi:hypothetical protein